MDSDTDVSVSSTKKSGCIRLQISLHGRQKVTKEGSDLREMIMMESVTTINLFGDPKIITNKQKAEIPIKWLTKCRFKNII